MRLSSSSTILLSSLVHLVLSFSSSSTAAVAAAAHGEQQQQGRRGRGGGINTAVTTTKKQFLQAMRETELEQDKKQRRLRLEKSILAAAIPSHEFQKKTKKKEGRFLADNYYNNYYNSNNNGNNYYANGQQAEAAAAAAQDEYANYAFNITKYSLKYAGCSSIATYSDDLAMDEDASSVFAVDQYVVFRFCPTKTCSASSTYGCMSDYGEYMVPIESWLEIISEYRYEEFERYCDYCAACYGGGDNNQKQYYGYGNRNMEDAAAAQGDDAAAAAQGDDAVAGDDGGAAGQGNYYVNDCSYKSQCSGYADVCNNQNHVDLSKFFECKEYEANDDLTLYLGPHCASDKKTILLGVYDDQYCSNYVGDKYDLGTLTGMTLTSDMFTDYYQSDCIPCQESSLKFQNVNNDNVDVDSVNELCENLYGYSAKCNRHVGGATSASYQSYQQQDNELAVCSYIASVVTGTYDEYGFIYVDPLSFESDNKYNQYTKIAMRKGVVMSSQIIGILFFVLVMIGMAIYAAILHVRIQRGAEMMESLKEPIGVERKDSGIILARSGTTDTYRAPNGVW